MDQDDQDILAMQFRLKRELRNDLCHFAIQCAIEGWSVYPIGKDGVPLVENWREEATTDDDLIYDWWEKWPYAHVGVVHTLLSVDELYEKFAEEWRERLDNDTSWSIFQDDESILKRSEN